MFENDGNNDDPYEILGVSQDASDVEIERAYRSLALEKHPDSAAASENGKKADAEAEFARLSGAYELLSDPDERHQVDLRRKYGGDANVRYDEAPSAEAEAAATTDSDHALPDDFPEASPEAEQLERSYRESGLLAGQDGARTKKTTLHGQTQGKYPKGKFTFRRTVIDPDNLNSRIFQDPYDVFREVFGKDYDKDMTAATGSDKDRGDGKHGKAKSQEEKKSGSNNLPPGGLPSDIDANGKYNPVMKMSSRVKTICHPDGSQEIVKEVIVTRKDGSVETKSENVCDEVVPSDDEGEDDEGGEEKDGGDSDIQAGVSGIDVGN